mmetsp:Transcript_9880/g.22551  ORF Transcript_9880/g.22551 Transcript_9880/m.22551 type:complete len:242 (-) Transcript_9880:160-885(-)
MLLVVVDLRKVVGLSPEPVRVLDLHDLVAIHKAVGHASVEGVEDPRLVRGLDNLESVYLLGEVAVPRFRDAQGSLHTRPTQHLLGVAPHRVGHLEHVRRIHVRKLGDLVEPFGRLVVEQPIIGGVADLPACGGVLDGRSTVQLLALRRHIAPLGLGALVEEPLHAVILTKLLEEVLAHLGLEPGIVILTFTVLGLPDPPEFVSAALDAVVRVGLLPLQAPASLALVATVHAGLTGDRGVRL